MTEQHSLMKRVGRRIRNEWILWLMLLPGLLFFIIFKYVPMYGVVMAFQNFRLARGFFRSPWVGLANFERYFPRRSFRSC